MTCETKRGSRWIRATRIVATIGVSLAAAGCGAVNSFYTEPDITATRPLVQWQETAHQVNFDAQGHELTQSERAGLDRFLAGIANRDQRRVTLLTGTEDDAARRQLQQRRAAAVIGHLRARQIGVAQVSAMPGTRYRDAVVVSAAHLTVVTQDCPDWRRIRQGGSMIGRRDDFGCVTSAALGSMVANPRDLIRGREMGASEAEALGTGVRKYRDGTLGDDQRRESFTTTSTQR